MTEAYLHYLWQFQHFDARHLHTTTGDALHILATGMPHRNAGADFQQARVRLAGMEWAGAVEIHVRASDWQRHGHQHDAAYENVILHVVWEEDLPLFRPDGTPLPTLALAGRAPAHTLACYERWLAAPPNALPCGEAFRRASALNKRAMLDAALLERLEQKAETFLDLLKNAQSDWEEALWRWLCRSFGFSLNAEPMQQLAETLPLGVIARHRNQPFAIEALLLGTAGLLPLTDPPDDYTRRLQAEYTFLQKKYKLTPLNAHQWKLLRLRPAGFPGVRLAQVAALLHQEPRLSALLLQENNPERLRNRLRVRQSAYWQQHYVLGKRAGGSVPGLGRQSLESLVINTVVVARVAQALYRGQREDISTAVDLLEQLPAEDHLLTRLWADYGLQCRTAADSQGGIGWQQLYCRPRRCLSCKVGLELLRRQEGA